MSVEVRTNPPANGLTPQVVSFSGARVPFEFVNTTALDRISGPEVKKLVRSHARRVRRYRSGPSVDLSRLPNQQPRHHMEDCYNQTAVPTMNIGVGFLDPFGSYAIPMQPYMHELIFYCK